MKKLLKELKNNSHFFDWGFQDKVIKSLPLGLGREVAKTALYKLKNGSRIESNRFLSSIKEISTCGQDKLISSDNSVIELSNKSVHECILHIAPYHNDIDFQFLIGLEYCKRRGIVFSDSDLKKHEKIGWVNRFKCELWWRRKLRKLHARLCENIGIKIGLVHLKRGQYASDNAVKKRQDQNFRNNQILEKLIAVNDIEQEYTLAELSYLSVSNPVIRRGELMMRIAGFEQIAVDEGYVGEFYTFTCPSRFHARSYKTGKEYHKYDGSTPKQGQKYLCDVWAKIRSKLKRDKVMVFGFRVAEPMHDGTPHWHMLLFMSPANRLIVREICRNYSLKDSPNEVGAKRFRFDAKKIDWEKGSAAGYIAKYIAKNIDGVDVGEDFYGENAQDSSKRVAAWAACWGIRQFQQIGGASVTVWRELRRMEEGNQGLVEDARLAADVADWAEYNYLQGGMECARSAHKIKLSKWLEFDGSTGEFLDCPVDIYGEDSKGKVFGVNCDGDHFLTRIYKWVIGHADLSLDSGLQKVANGYSANDLADVIDSSKSLIKIEIENVLGFCDMIAEKGRMKDAQEYADFYGGS